MYEALYRSKAVLFDLDGTLIRGEKAIPGAVSFVRQLAEMGKRIVYLTNNATRTREAVALMLSRQGFPASPEMVLTSSVAAAALIQHHLGIGKKVYAIGEEGLTSPLLAAECEWVKNEEHADAVVVGLHRQVTYAHFEHAVRHVLRGAFFLATNRDRVIPLENGFAPGAGALVALIAYATGVEPMLAGKPSAAFVDEALAMAGVERTDAILIGDNLETDILAAKNAGIHSVLVESGVPSADNFFPDIKVNNLTELLH